MLKSSQYLKVLFVLSLGGSILLWVLRGIGLLTFLPSGPILSLGLVAIATGLLTLIFPRF